MASWCETTLANLPDAEAELRRDVDAYTEFWAIVGQRKHDCPVEECEHDAGQ
jgi:hypothetical protein